MATKFLFEGDQLSRLTHMADTMFDDGIPFREFIETVVLTCQAWEVKVELFDIEDVKNVNVEADMISLIHLLGYSVDDATGKLIKLEQ